MKNDVNYDNRFDEIIKELENNHYSVFDKIEIFFYRNFGNTYDFFRYNLIQGIKNFWRFKKVIWRHRWYDYSFSDDVVEECYKIMAENWYKSHYIGGDKDELELIHIVELFEKMNNIEPDVYYIDEEGALRENIYKLIGENRYWD